MAVRILIADDHGVLRAGLRALLHAEPDLLVVGEAADGQQTLALAQELRPDVVLLDIAMPGLSGIDVARELRQTCPATRTLMLTMHEDKGLLQASIRAGACGYIVKRAVEADLITAIRTVSEGQTYIHPSMAWAAPPEPPPAIAESGNRAEELSEQETEVLRLLAQSYTNRQIADTLGIDVAAVEGQRTSLTNKLGLPSRVALIRYAREHGLLEQV